VTVINWPPQLLPPLPPGATSAVVPFVRPPVLPPPAGPAVVAAGLPLLKAAAVVALAVGAGVLLAQVWTQLNNKAGARTSRWPDLDSLPEGFRIDYPNPGGATEYEVLGPQIYSQFRFIQSTVGPVFYLKPALPGECSPSFYGEPGWKVWLRWVRPSGVISDVQPSFSNCANPETGFPSSTGFFGFRLRIGDQIIEPLPFPPRPLRNFPEPEPQTEPLPEPERPRPFPPVIAPPVPGSRPLPPPQITPRPPDPNREPETPREPLPPRVPQTPPLITPQPAPVPTDPDLRPRPDPEPAPRPTPPDDHIIGRLPIPSRPPQPTLEGIARELGRLENKAALLLDPGRAPTGPNRDRLGNLEDWIKPLFEAFFQLFASGTYELSSPCELNEAGERVPVVVPFGPGLSALGTLHNKVDALAELLQASKDLKQPICKQTPAIGEPVTVNFEQVS